MLAIVRFPEGITKDDVDTDTPLILEPGSIEPIRQYVFSNKLGRLGRTAIYAWFDKAELLAAISDSDLTNNRIELEVVGQLNSGQEFFGTDTIKIKPKPPKPKKPKP